MNILRWIYALPAGIITAVLATFPIHWIILLISNFGESPLFLGLVSVETFENCVIAFSTPFLIVRIGAKVVPSKKMEAGIGIAIIVALVMGALYMLAFTGGPIYGGWDSLYYGVTPILNIIGLVSALYAIRDEE